MPSGYTAKLYEGTPQTFQEFALDCARAFGALILMRDDPMDAEIPDEFKSDTRYYDESIERARQRLAYLSTMSGLAVEDEIIAQRDRLQQEYEADIAARAPIRERYEEMLRQAIKWRPPSAEHENMKAYMINQLQDSIKHDCTPYRSSLLDEPIPTVQAWLDEQSERALKDLTYYAAEREKEIERAKGRSTWVRLLKESLV